MRLHHVQISMPAGQEDLARRFYADALGLMPATKVHPGLLVEDGAALSVLAVRIEECGFEVSWAERTTFTGYERFPCRDGFGNRVEVMTPA